MTDILNNLRSFLKDKDAGAILINSTDNFLSEYVLPENNSRAKLTGFTGSAGDCLVTSNEAFLFVDGRYHEQADSEVDKNIFTVVKMQPGQKLSDEIVSRLNNGKLLLISKKISVNFSNAIEAKYSNIEYIADDPVAETNKDDNNLKVISVNTDIVKFDIEQKKEKLVQKLKEDEVILITDKENFSYYTNLRCFDIPYSSSVPGKIILSVNKGTIYSDVDFECQSYEKKSLADFEKDLPEIKNSVILCDCSEMSKFDYDLIDKSNKLKEPEFFKDKSQKNDKEIAHIKDCFAATDRVMAKVDNFISSTEKFTEEDLYNAVEKFFKEEGAVSLSFKPITASGKNTSLVHFTNPDKNKTVKDGELILVDIGGYFEGGYATDITRTFVKGNPDSRQKTVYTKVLKAFIATYTKDYSSSNPSLYDIDRTARDLLENDECGYVFSHSLGHGVGISVHEYPNVSSVGTQCFKKLKKYYVFSIEPGLYKPGENGVRLETVVYARTVSPNLQLTALSKYKFEEKLIDRQMLSPEELKFLKKWQNYGN